MFAGTWLAYVGFYLCRKNFSVLMPLLGAHLLFTKEDLASLIFFYSVAYAIGQFASGTLADRFGAKAVVAGGMLVSAFCNLLMSGSSAFSFFLVLQCCNGMAQSCGWPGLVKITAAWFDPQRRGVFMAWWTTNYALGGLIATIVATWLATGNVLPFLGWRRGAGGPALLLILVATVFLALVKERPSLEDSRERTVSPWADVLRSRNIWSICVSYFCLKLMRYAFLFWLPMYLVERLNYAPGKAGFTSAVYEIAGFFGVVLAGYLSDRPLRGRRFPVSSTMMLGLTVVCIAFPALSELGATGSIIAIGLAGMLTFGPDTLLGGAATQDSSSPSSTATAAGFVNGTGTIGQLMSPLLVVQIVKFYGWDSLFAVFAGISVIGALALAVRWNSESNMTPQLRAASA